MEGKIGKQTKQKPLTFDDGTSLSLTLKKCLDCESNTGPSDLQSDALPTELSRRNYVWTTKNSIRMIYFFCRNVLFLHLIPCRRPDDSLRAVRIRSRMATNERMPRKSHQQKIILCDVRKPKRAITNGRESISCIRKDKQFVNGNHLQLLVS